MSDLNELISDLSVAILGVRNPRTGRVIEFSLSRNENTYLYFKPRGSSKQFCYTPHADRDGWYYSFVYLPKGKGARTGTAVRWYLARLLPHRKRKDAKKRALRMYHQELGKETI